MDWRNARRVSSGEEATEGSWRKEMALVMRSSRTMVKVKRRGAKQRVFKKDEARITQVRSFSEVGILDNLGFFYSSSYLGIVSFCLAKPRLR